MTTVEKASVRVYLDNNATTRVDDGVLESMWPFYEEEYGNASSVHGFGRRAHAVLESARNQVAELIGTRTSEIYFTGSGTEADNWALKGVAYAQRERGQHLITSSVEHHAVLNTCRYLEQQGWRVTYLPVDSAGLVDPEEVRRALTAQTVLVSIMHANNETGVVQPVSEIGRIVRERGVLFHTDAVQSVGKLRVSADALNVDLLSLSGHKLYGPKGIGALYIRQGTRIEALQHGGHHENSLRAGTENVPAIVGLGMAAELARQNLAEEQQYLVELRERLWQGIQSQIRDVHLNGAAAERLPNTLNISVGGVEGEAVLMALDLAGIAVSSGSACTAGDSAPSHVLRAMGLDALRAQGAIRFSLGKFNSAAEIDYTIEQVAAVINKLRAISPLYRTAGKGPAA
jgi:cysteine desulfurase